MKFYVKNENTSNTSSKVYAILFYVNDFAMLNTLLPFWKYDKCCGGTAPSFCSAIFDIIFCTSFLLILN